MSKRAQMRQRAREKPRQDRTTLWVTIGTVAVAAVILVALVLTRQPGASSTATDNPSAPNPEVARVGLADARARFQQPGVVFLDTRSAQEYADAHIPGALNIPLPEIPTRFNEIPRDAEVIAYCT